MMNVTTIEFSNNNKIEKQYINIYERLQRIVKSYYGAKLTYKAFSSELTKAEKTLIELLKKNKPMTLKNKVFFPVEVENTIIGFSEVELTRTITKTESARLQQLIDLLLVHSIKSSRHIKKMREEEQLTDMSTKEDTSASNVVYLSNFNQKQESKTQQYIPEAYRPDPITKPALKFNLPALIECRKPEESFKMARELHDLSDRFAFIRLQDLDLSAAAKDGINSFGPITIFVPEISKLTKEQQNLIIKFYKTERRTKQSPTFIMASVHPKFILQESNVVHQELILRQAAVTLPMTKDLKHYKEMGLLDFVLGSMSKNVIN